MTPQILHTAKYMHERGRRYRSSPVDSLPSAERYCQVERLLEATWELSKSLGLHLGSYPTIVYTGENLAPPHILLKNISQLQVELLATNLMLGLGNGLVSGVLAITRTPPAHPSPDFQIIVDQEWPELERKEVETGDDDPIRETED